MNIYIFGETGRLGALLCQYINLESRVFKPEQADIWLLAVPAAAVPEIIEKAGERWVIDLSGHSKRMNIGHYGWTVEQPPTKTRLIQNPGCIASSVIFGLEASRLSEQLETGCTLQVTAVCGRSVAHKSEPCEQPRLSKRLWTHPHIHEIQQCFPNVVIQHFTPIIHQLQPHGIFCIVTGTSANKIVSGGQPVELSKVIGTPHFSWQLRVDSTANKFVLNTALDNRHSPVAHAVKWVSWITNQASS